MSNMERATASLRARVLVGTLLVGWLCGCAAMLPKLEAPKLQVMAVNIGHGNLQNQKIDVTLSVDNPNNRVLDISGIDLSIALSGKDFATGETAEAFVVPALGSTQFTVKLTANLETALKLMALSYGAETIPYRITGTVKLGSGLIRTLPFKTDGQVPMRR